MLLQELVTVSDLVSGTPSRREKTRLLAAMLGTLSPDEAESAVSYLAGKPRQSPLGVGYATVYSVDVDPAAAAQLEIREVDRMLAEVASTAGAGSKARKEALLGELFARATAEEQEFLRGLILKNLRQGALEGVMVDAVAQALDVPSQRVRRASMLEGDLVAVASRALVEGPELLATAQLQLLTPVQPMLAKTAETADSAVERLGLAIVEWKLDGARVQVHRDRDRIAVFTRNLRDVTKNHPELVAAALHLDAERFILDGESLILGPDGAPVSFQDSMSRFGSEGPDETEQLSAFFFDCLHLDGEDIIDWPLADRKEVLASFVPEEAQVGSILTNEPTEGGRFFDEAVSKGFEGVVVKDPKQSYEAGRRGSGWLKVKPTHTLDLVVLAAEWGSGRRRGWLSNLHLGARGPDGEFVMLGKTFKGLTDEMLGWQTQRFLEIEDRRDGRTVYVRPEIVYEIAFDGIQRSSRYPGDVALRFARVRRHRSDKGPADADTIETVRSFARRA